MLKKYLIPLSFVFLFTPLAVAQSSDTTPTDKKPAEAPKVEAQPGKPQMQKKSAPQDLDSFFKEGERQAKEGLTCRKKPEPVA